MDDAGRLDRLVPRLRKLDQTAFGELHDLLATRMIGFAAGQLGSRHAAEDAVQDVLVELTRHLPRFRGDGRALLAWVFTALRNRCTDQHRRRRRRHEDLHAEVPDATTSMPVHHHPDPDLAHALAQLTEAQRVAVLLRRVSGLGGDEVADIMGLERTAVYALCARAEERLRALLATSDLAPRSGGETG